jgi:hypothetical protein
MQQQKSFDAYEKAPEAAEVAEAQKCHLPRPSLQCEERLGSKRLDLSAASVRWPR